MFRVVISRLTDDGLRVTPERKDTAMSVSEAVSFIRRHLPGVDTGAFGGDAVQSSVNRVNDFRCDVSDADGGHYRVVIAPMI
ncbi:hypothetical protein [Nocardiopsis halotolerans]|uniref:hypothetical protein n=1 Tax=Nocardiopsis halotolerans TaxID=124252 RepID=UPI000346FC7B|nr:hypothetical protein [Nocardiopsis halotolerans]